MIINSDKLDKTIDDYLFRSGIRTMFEDSSQHGRLTISEAAKLVCMPDNVIVHLFRLYGDLALDRNWLVKYFEAKRQSKLNNCIKRKSINLDYTCSVFAEKYGYNKRQLSIIIHRSNIQREVKNGVVYFNEFELLNLLMNKKNKL